MGLILCLLSLVLYLFSPYELFPQLAPYRLQIVILIPTLAISAISLVMRPSTFQKPQFYLVLGLWFAVCMSDLSKLWLRGTLYVFIDFAFTVFVYFVVAVNSFTAARIRVVCLVLVISALVMSVMGVMAYHTGFMEDKLVLKLLGENFRLIKRVRALGTLADPNDLAQFLIVGMAMLGVFWRKGHTGLNLLKLGIPAAVIIYTVFLTGSRGALFGLAAVAFVVISTRLGAMPSIVLAGATMVLLILAGFGHSTITLNEERVTAWGTGINMLKSHPLFGIGYNQFVEHSSLTAHNSFVLCFAEIGFFGYFFWLSLIVVSVLGLQSVLRLPVENPEEEKAARLVQPLRAALFSYLATGWFLSRTYNPVLFILVALAGALIQVRGHQGMTLVFKTPRWFRTTIGLQFASVILIYMTIRARAF